MSLLDFGVQAFASLFVLLSPITVAPVYAAMTRNFEPSRARSTAIRAVMAATIVLVIMSLAGEAVFKFFSISTDSLRVVGGVIFFLMGYDMLQARQPRAKYSDESTQEFAQDIAVSPLGIPLLAGPGAITTAIVLFNDAVTPSLKAVFYLALALVMSVSLMLLLGVKTLGKYVGANGQRIATRLIGLIEMAFAVEFFFAGLGPIVREMMAA
ncbi:MAG: MarC family protein [Actinomycetota bacterium]